VFWQKHVAGKVAGKESWFRVDVLKFVLAANRVAVNPTFNSTRRLLKPMVLDGVKYNEGAFLSLSNQVHYLSADEFKFDPDRWLDDSRKPKPWNFLAFGSGQHMCPGRFFAISEAQVILSLLVLKFDIASVSGEVVNTFTMNRSGMPFKVRFERRRIKKKLFHVVTLKNDERYNMWITGIVIKCFLDF
jgi:hypothetical protein